MFIYHIRYVAVAHCLNFVKDFSHILLTAVNYIMEVHFYESVEMA